MKCKIGLIILSLLLCLGHKSNAKNYYFDSKKTNAGAYGTIEKPYTDLTIIQQLQLQPGDSVLLAEGAVFKGIVKIINQQGSVTQPIVIDKYNTKKPCSTLPKIDGGGYVSAILLENTSNIVIQNLQITANSGGYVKEATINVDTMRCGVLMLSTKPAHYHHIRLSHLIIEDVFFEKAGFVRNPEEVKSANGTQHYGWGIRFINNNLSATLSDIEVLNCHITNVEHTGIKFTAHHNIHSISVKGNHLTRTGGPGMQFSGVENGHISQNIITHSGSNDDSRKWGRGSGLWTWNCNKILIEHNQFLHANGPGDSAGAHIDYNCSNIIVQYNLSANNAGGFCEILGNNYNCAYRYNVSINDGYRIKGQNGAFQEGKLFWLSGYIGKEKPKGPYNSYFYNNTMYTKPELLTKIAVAATTNGLCVVNNIFAIEGETREVTGDQFRIDNRIDKKIQRVFFENNLFLSAKNWPSSLAIQDSNPIIGDPQFKNKGGWTINDYIPQNKLVIQDKGIPVPRIMGDSVGLYLGLEVNYDINGTAIHNRPDMGAIEISTQ